MPHILTNSSYRLNTTDFKQDFKQTSYLHNIYRFFPPYRTVQDDMQLKGEHTLWQSRRQSMIKTQLTTNLLEGFFLPVVHFVLM